MMPVNRFLKCVGCYTCYLLVYRLFLRRNGQPIVGAPPAKPALGISVDDLAVEWGWLFNEGSIQNEKERGGYMCVAGAAIPGATFSTGPHLLAPPHPPYHASLFVGAYGSRISCDPGNNGVPNVVATIHSHSNLSNGMNFGDFSNTDLEGDNHYQVPGYLVTPIGELKRHDPNALVATLGGGNFNSYFGGGYTVGKIWTLLVARSLPWDTRYDDLAGFARRVGDILDIIDHIYFALEL
jgi:hypothetical protein